MIRVAFVLTFDATGWLGGISYFRNLLGAMLSVPESQITPVIFAGEHTAPDVLDQFPKVETVRSGLLDSGGTYGTVRRLTAKLSGRDPALECLLLRHDIHALSHQGFFGGLSRIPVLGWIPDFQEHHLPEFFSAAELRARARKRVLFSKICTRVILSSNDARRDLEAVDPECASRARVLQFVANVTVPSREHSISVARRLGLETPYFHLPNQFWMHKNHGVVVEALRLLTLRGSNARVIATGNTADHRQPGQFQALMGRVHEAGVSHRFLTVGALAYPDVIALMAGAVAVINPSRFEGWSTTVEESKSLGKKILLSNLRVHREQAPQRGQYFSPDDPEGLAKLMEETLASHDPDAENCAQQSAQAQLSRRQEAFALRYQQIVLEAVRR